MKTKHFIAFVLNQDGKRPEKPGKVREFENCGKVRELLEYLLIVREISKNLDGI